ncbi:MAG: hypothetical protein LBJ71_04260 [Holosporaceae bacterium]|jgi:hypothetical protein|nr:hypothetical protein [Holosporaceae bacterium]
MKKRRVKLLPASPRQLKYLRLFLRKITYLLEKLYGSLIRKLVRKVSGSKNMSEEDIRKAIFQLLSVAYSRKELLFEKNVRKITKKYIRSVVTSTSVSIKKTLEKNDLPFSSSATEVEKASTEECVDHLLTISGWFLLKLFHYAVTGAYEKMTEQHLEDLLVNRAKLITRTQISRAITAENIARFREAGLTHYVWRTSQDERVVGNPTGLYPEGNPSHEDHYHRNGKVFAFDNPPDDGHPGVPYNCRCVMLAIVKRNG